MVRDLRLFAVVGVCGIAGMMLSICVIDSLFMGGWYSSVMLREYRTFLNGISPWALIVIGVAAFGWWFSFIVREWGAELDLKQALQMQDPRVAAIDRFIQRMNSCAHYYLRIAALGLSLIGWGTVRLIY